MKRSIKSEEEVHKWGAAKQITFEPDKESMSIISHFEPEGPDFKLMGIWFDTVLSMKRGVTEMCNKLRWKLTTLLRTRSLFDTPTLMIQFKSRILSFVEHRTSAIYHADSTVLDAIDKQYDRFLSSIGDTNNCPGGILSCASERTPRYGNAWGHTPMCTRKGSPTNSRIF